jgi:hypothetical protein
MKKVLKGASIAVAIIIVLMTALYFALGLYYVGGFPCFTWINGIYCTGKSVSEVNAELLKSAPYDGIAIMDKSGARLFVSSADTDLTMDYTGALTEVYRNTDPLKWGLYAFKNLTCEYEPDVMLSRDKVAELVSDWEIFIDPSDLKCSIVKTADGYVLENVFISLPDQEKVIDKVYESMQSRQSVLDLSNYEECYKELDIRSSDRDKVEVFTKLDRLQDCNITYDLEGIKIVLDKGSASDFILTERDYDAALSEKTSTKNPGLGHFIIAGEEKSLPEREDIKIVEGIVTDADYNPVVSESKIYAFLENVADSHDTSWMMDEYRKGISSTIIVNSSSKGDGVVFDIRSEFDYLKDLMLSGTMSNPEERELKLSENAVVYDANEKLGKTYIEVDMGKQMLYYYVDGELNMDMPVVTGNVNRSRGTPTGIYPVYNKRYHTYLRGVDYVSYVNYWLGVNKGVGIHDANWRSKFGDEIYKSDGSHGCINCPYDSVEVLWDVVDIGTPVILYY